MHTFAAPETLTSHPWIVAFDRLADQRAFVVGGPGAAGAGDGWS